VRRARADVVRRLIARAIVGDRDGAPRTIGEITLRPHQHAAAARLLALIERNGGAMLAEPVGLGKTYTSLAVAAALGDHVTLVIPSSLRDTWRESLARSRTSAEIITHEALSRGVRMPIGDGIVIVDEAHRARSPGTRRYAALAELCKRARVLLLTATPVQNRRADLAAQLALFLGRRAWAMGDEELASHVVRGGASELEELPSLNGPHAIELETVDDCLDQIVALPPPVPASDESVVTALLTYGLIHQWSSSRAALLAALNRRRARGLALLSALDAGRRPTRAELSAWTYTGDGLQLAFPELVTAAPSAATDIGLAALTVAVDRHNAAVEALIRRLRSGVDPDDERARILRRIRDHHPDERIIAFCHYAETVNALRAKLAFDSGIAALTANGARIAGGRLPRAAVLAQFTPSSSPRAPGSPLSRAERIDLLLTTDLLSEGLNLQEASVVVHLDLPWNPARLDQRVGRVRRIGSRFTAVSVYSIAPPAPAEQLLQIERRLREKLSVAQRSVGIAGRILPSPLEINRERRGLAESSGSIESVLRAWADEPGGSPESVAECTNASHDESLVSAVRCGRSGFLAVVRDRDGPQLVVDVAGATRGISTAPDHVRHALDLALGDDVPVAGDQADDTLMRITHWLDARRGASTIDLSAAAAARFRRATLARVSQALERAPRHRRAQLALLADAARAIAIAPLAEGAERILETLAKAELPDEAWLRSIATFGALNARPAPGCADGRVRGRARIECVILFQAASE
jgi:superfamily II DNA or RNA helicase